MMLHCFSASSCDDMMVSLSFSVFSSGRMRATILTLILLKATYTGNKILDVLVFLISSPGLPCLLGGAIGR